VIFSQTYLVTLFARLLRRKMIVAKVKNQLALSVDVDGLFKLRPRPFFSRGNQKNAAFSQLCCYLN
jgi:hypothetical protein